MMSIEQPTLAPADFARIFGVSETGIDDRLRHLIAERDFCYSPLGPQEAGRVADEIRSRLDRQDFTQVGEHRLGIWRDAWSETLDRFVRSGYAVSALDPSFMGANLILRLDGRFVRAADPAFERRFFEVFRDWLFRTWLADVGSLWEFGCGSGFNLAAYAALYPGRRIVGLDWAESAVEIAELLRTQRGLPVSGRRFDFFAPDTGLDLASDSAVLTMCALEQTGTRFRPFLDFIRSKAPRRVVHMEPVVDLYDPDNPVDALAIRYHRDRGYLDGLLPCLRDLDAAGEITLRVVRRLRFGSLFHEGFTLIVWEPR